MKRTEDGSLPEVSDSVIKIAQILQKDVLMLMDDLDALTTNRERMSSWATGPLSVL